MSERKYRIGRRLLIVSFIPIVLFNTISYGQAKRENKIVKGVTWVLLQAIPSPTLFEDRGSTGAGTEFGLEWQVVPYSYTFRPNKLLSHHNFFYLKPVKRFSGSIELFFTPQYVTGSWDNSSLKKFMFNTGTRVIFPLAQRGEYLCFSLGVGYHRQIQVKGGVKDGLMYEAGIYSIFGMAGLKFNYKPSAYSRYNITLYIKYY